MKECKDCKTKNPANELFMGRCEPCMQKSDEHPCTRCVDGVAEIEITHNNGFAEDICSECDDQALEVMAAGEWQ